MRMSRFEVIIGGGFLIARFWKKQLLVVSAKRKIGETNNYL